MPRQSRASRQSRQEPREDSYWRMPSASSSWRFMLSPQAVLVVTLLAVIICQHDIEGFRQSDFSSSTAYIGSVDKKGDGPSNHHRISAQTQHRSSRYLDTCTFSDRASPRSRTVLYENPKGKSVPPSDKSLQQQQRQTRSVIQSFFSSSDPEPDPIPQPQDEDRGGWRNLFRRNKEDDQEDDSKDKASKQQDKPKPSSTTNKQQQQPAKEPIKKPVLSEKLRQQAAEEQKRVKVKTKDKQEGKVEIEEETSLWGRVLFWRRGNSTDADKDDAGSSNDNSTNPISAVQKYWQETVNRRNEEWIDVIPKTRLSPGEVVPVTVGGLDLLIIAGLTSGSRVYAIANSCPHLGTPLEVGQLVRLPKEGTPSESSSSDTIVNSKEEEAANRWTELQVSSLLQQDGCEDCIVCPLHRTAFALESGQVRGEWCPYPPVVGKLTSLIKEPTPVATFDVRVRKKNIQVRLNSPLPSETKEKKKD